MSAAPGRMARSPVVASIAGGFVRVEVASLLRAWHICRSQPGGGGDFRFWLSAHEFRIRRGRTISGSDSSRKRSADLAELARLCGVQRRRASDALRRLTRAGLIHWDAARGVVELPAPGVAPEGDPRLDPIVASLPGRAGMLAIPRRVLRFLVSRSRPALIATVLGILLRCLSRRQAGWRSTGRVKASWIARVFQVDLRRVKAARAELIGLAWLATVEGTSAQSSWNRWGRAYRVDLAWVPPVRFCHPSPPRSGRELPPPDLDPAPVPDSKNPDPHPGETGFPGDWLKLEGITPTPVPDPIPPQGSSVRGARPAPAPADRAAPPQAAPRLKDIQVNDLRSTERTLELHQAAVRAGWTTASEADRFRFVGAAVHALSVGATNPAGLFRAIVVGRRWGLLTQGDEDVARQRLRAEPKREADPLGSPPGARPAASAGRLAALGAILGRFAIPSGASDPTPVPGEPPRSGRGTLRGDFTAGRRAGPAGRR